jgi:N-acetylglucosamine transport system substrate-binding protein
VALACASALLVGVAACGDNDEPGGSSGGNGAEKTADNPFGVEEGSEGTALIVSMGYQDAKYVQSAADLAGEKLGFTFTVDPTEDPTVDIPTRMASGDVPDAVSFSGQQDLLPVLEPLDDLWDAVNYDGVKISDALLPIAKFSGTYDGKFLGMPLVVNEFALWYSQSLFEENGWTPPTTWDEMMALGEAAKAEGKYLFTFGKEAANYWWWFADSCAQKQGGLEVWLNQANLVPDAWFDPAVVGCFEKIQETIDKGYWVPGGAGTQFTQAQAAWSLDQEALFYFSGSWIENEMADATKEGFDMAAWPVPLLDPATAALPFDALMMNAGEQIAVPTEGKNKAAAKEVLRALSSKESATYFAESNKAVSVVKGVVPDDGWGSTAIVSQARLAEAAGDNILYVGGDTWCFGYGIDSLNEWNEFLSGEITAQEMLRKMQDKSDAVMNDSSVEKIEYKL